MPNTTQNHQKMLQDAGCEESVKLLWFFVRNVPAPVAMVDREMRYIIVSQRWLTDYRLKEESVIGRSHYEVFPEIPTSWKEIHQRCLAGAIEKNDGDPFLRADGSLDWVRWEVRPWRNSAGEIGGLVMFTEVITELKKNELALRDLTASLENRVQERTRQLSLETAELEGVLNSILESVWIYDNDGRLRKMNAAAAELFRSLDIAGLADQTIANRFSTWNAQTVSGEPLSLQDFPPFRALRGESLRGIPIRFQPKNCSPAWFLVSAAPLKTADNVTHGAVATFVDISQQKQNEEKYSSIFKTAMDGFWIMSPNGNFVEVNDTFCEMNGYSREELLKMNIKDLEAKETSTETAQHIEQVINTTGRERFETLHRRKDGQIIDVEISTSSLVSKAPLIVVFARDITERKQLERELRHTIESRDEFLAIASHEIKTPLTALRLQLALMLNLAKKILVIYRENERAGLKIAPELERLEQLIRYAETQGIRITRLLDNLLDLTRIKAGKFGLEIKPADLMAIARSVAAQVTSEAAAAETQISIKGPDSVIGFWDPSRIEQVIQNLVSNAIKYGLGKPIAITVGTDPLNDTAFVEVEDHGVGIPPELHERIFTRFERGQADRKIPGTGLGLYIVRRIVETHGGTIVLKSEQGRGSIFKIILPYRVKNSQKAA